MATTIGDGRRFAMTVAAMVVAAPLAGLAVSDAWRAGRLTDGDAVTAPDDFRSLRLAGARALQAGHLSEADALFRRAAALSPMDAETLRLLASAERLQGRPAAQTAWLRLAARLTLRDHPTQRRLVLAAFTADNMPAAVIHADALLRSQPGDALGLATMMIAMNDGAGRAALADRLSRSPPWRQGVFDAMLIGDREDADGLVALLGLMHASGAPPTPGENSTAVAKLIAAGFGGVALDYWRRASGHPADHAYLNDDPDFRQALPTLQTGEPAAPFGWATGWRSGVQIGGGRDAAGRSALTFDGPPDGVDAVVSRFVVLSPGSYRLLFAAAADGRPTSRVRPRFACATDGRRLSFDTLHPSEADGYLQGRVAVVVPPDCTAVRLDIGLSPGDDGQMHGFALRHVVWTRAGA